MNIKEFEDLVDLHGEDLSRWPQALRVPAMSLLERSEDARKVVGQAKRLRELFKTAPQVRAPAGLVDRIMVRAAASDESAADNSAAMPSFLPWYERMDRALRPTLLLSCLTFGIVAGLLTAPRTETRLSLDTPTIFADFVQ